MKNVFFINAHEPWSFSECKLHRSLVQWAAGNLKNKGYDTQMTTMQANNNVKEETETHMRTDTLIRHSPCNLMDVPWTFTKYKQSISYTAPLEAFNDSNQNFLRGWGVDDSSWPMHLNFKFFGVAAFETFACHDVFKNPDAENDFIRFKAHHDRLFPNLN